MFSINPNVILTAPMVIGSLITIWALTMIISQEHRTEMLIGLVIVSLPIYVVIFFAKQMASVISGLIVSLARVIGQAGTE